MYQLLVRKIYAFTHKAPPIICSRRQFQILPLFKNNILGTIFNENRLLADDSHVISYFIFVENWKDVANVVCCSRDKG